MNRAFIEQEKRYKKIIVEMVPVIYSAFAVALLREFGFGFKRILRVLAETHALWNDHKNGVLDIVKTCQEETGIDMMTEMTARETGAEGERI